MDLEKGKSEKIEIFANSDPKELAYNFCIKYNLDFNTLDYLKDQITKLLEVYNRQANEGNIVGELDIHENDDENNKEGVYNAEDDKEGDINISEIEAGEILEKNSNKNNNDNNLNNNNDFNNNNEDIFKINCSEKNKLTIKEIDNNDYDNQNKISDSNDIEGEKEGDCNNMDIDDNDNDEILKEDDYRNILKGKMMTNFNKLIKILINAYFHFQNWKILIMI